MDRFTPYYDSTRSTASHVTTISLSLTFRKSSGQYLSIHTRRKSGVGWAHLREGMACTNFNNPTFQVYRNNIKNLPLLNFDNINVNLVKKTWYQMTIMF